MFAQTISRSLIVMFMLLMLSACSFKSIYNRLDDLIPEYIDDIVSMDETLEQTVELRSQVLLDWHRHNQLKLYAHWMQEVQQEVITQFTSHNALQRINEIEGFWKNIVAKTNDELAVLLPMLDKNQQAELFNHLTDSNEKFSEKYIDIDEKSRIAAYHSRLTESYESWMGELTAQQQADVKQAANSLSKTADLRLQSRLRWQAGIGEILHSGESVESKTEKLKVYLKEFEKSADDLMLVKSASNRSIIAQLTMRLAAKMQPQQKTYFTEKTNDYIRIFIELAEGQ